MRSFLLIFLLTFFVFSFSPSVIAGEQHTIDHVKSDWGTWTIFDLTFPLYKDKVSGYLCVFPITVNKSRDLNPLILRAGLLYNLNKKLSFGILFDRNGNFTNKVDFNEYRITEQVSYKHTFKNFDRFTLSGRVRIKERMFEHLGTLVQPAILARASLGLGHTKRWYLVAYEEFLFNINKIPGREAGFAESRPFFGFGRKITPNITLEIGWQPSLINSAGRRADIWRNYISSYLSFKIPYKSNKSKVSEKTKIAEWHLDPSLIAFEDKPSKCLSFYNEEENNYEDLFSPIKPNICQTIEKPNLLFEKNDFQLASLEEQAPNDPSEAPFENSVQDDFADTSNAMN